MSRDSSGTYAAPSNSVNPAVEGTAIDETDFNALVTDLASALTDSLDRTGKGKITAHIDFDETTVSSPAANVGRLYGKDVGGVTSLFFKDNAGTDTNLTASAREKLTANRTYYVRTDGDDINTGLANTAGGAFLTIQKAVDVAAALDFGGYVITIQVATGTYAAGAALSKDLVGASGPEGLVIQGDVATPANCIVMATGSCFSVNASGKFTVRGFTIASATAFGIVASYGAGSRILYDAIVFGSCAIGWVHATRHGYCEMTDDCWISGGSQYGLLASHHGNMRFVGGNLTMLANFSVSGYFAWATSLGDITFTGGSIVDAGAFTATGIRYQIDSGALIQVNGAAIRDGTSTFFPGTVAGAITHPYVIKTTDISGGRERLSSARTYYVRTDGSNSNTGLANTAGGAFLTIQKAIDVVLGTLDLGGYNVSIQVGAGTYAENLTASSPQVGAGEISIVGDPTTPSNCVIDGSSTSFYASGGFRGTINGFELSPGTNFGITSEGHGTKVDFLNIKFAGAPTYHMYVIQGGTARATGAFSITAAATSFAYVTDPGSYLFVFGQTVTLTGTPAFTIFLQVEMTAAAVFGGGSFSGSATGIRYYVLQGGGLKLFSATLPGDVAGVVDGATYGFVV